MVLFKAQNVMQEGHKDEFKATKCELLKQWELLCFM